MLVLTRRLGEGLKIGNNVKITVVKINKSQIKLGISISKDETVNRRLMP